MTHEDDGKTLARLTAIANEIYRAWDEDKDSKVGKLLAALAGGLSYRADIDQLRADIYKIEARQRWADSLSKELDKGDSWAWIREKFERCRTQFKWYTPREDNLKGTRYEVMGWLHVLFAHADPKVYIDITVEHQKKADDALRRAEAAEAEVERLTALLRDQAVTG